MWKKFCGIRLKWLIISRSCCYCYYCHYCYNNCYCCYSCCFGFISIITICENIPSKMNKLGGLRLKPILFFLEYLLPFVRIAMVFILCKVLMISSQDWSAFVFVWVTIRPSSTTGVTFRWHWLASSHPIFLPTFLQLISVVGKLQLI